jgi:hypothetical protein
MPAIRSHHLPSSLSCLPLERSADKIAMSQVCHEPTFRLDPLWNVLALVTRQTDLDRRTPDLPVWEMSNRSPPVLAVDRRAPRV